MKWIATRAGLRPALLGEASRSTVAALRDQVDATAFAAAWAEGRATDIARAISYAVAPTGKAGTSGEK